MKTFKRATGEKTFNKAVKALIKDSFPQAAKIVKRHVAGVGYVMYIKNSFNKTVAHVFEEKGQMVILGKTIALN